MKKIIGSTRHGFTLMEILIAIAIIAVLTAIGIVSYGSINRNARNAKRKSDVGQMQSALELYRSDFGYYPAINTGGMAVAETLEENADFLTYLSDVPVDPKHVSYMYQALSENAGQYYGYCIAATLEPSDLATDTTCGTLDLGGYNYGRKNP
ncbi:MAG: prepilin-type N-terminal cleavage/methylation domain-containing protein [Microgenomates group bacterium]